MLSFPLPLLLAAPPFFSGSVWHSGTKSVRVSGPDGSPGRRGRDSGGRVHRGARPPRRRGLLGDGAARAKRHANPGRAQRHQHHTRALHVAAAEFRAGEDANLRGASPSPVHRVPHSLYAKYPVWVTTQLSICQPVCPKMCPPGPFNQNQVVRRRLFLCLSNALGARSRHSQLKSKAVKVYCVNVKVVLIFFVFKG